MPELNEPLLPPSDPSLQNDQIAQETVDSPPDQSTSVQHSLQDSLAVQEQSLASMEVRSAPQSLSKRRHLPVSVWLTAFLVPYAIISTMGVAYLFQQRNRFKEPHILESIPDQGLYEDFLDGRRREVIQPIDKAGNTTANTKIIPPNEPIGQEIPALKLGETRRVGQLEVTPQSVSKQQLRYAWRHGKPDLLVEEGLVLQLQIKNVGPFIFRPDDETFNRAFANSSKSPVYTFLEVGNDHYFGAIIDPVSEHLTFPSCSALQPGEIGMIFVVALRNSDGKKLVVNAINNAESYLWRVHLRRGKEEITLSTSKKRSVWLTTVVPVVFTKADIK